MCLLVSSLKYQYLSVLHRKDNKFFKEEIIFKDKIGRVRDVEIDQLIVGLLGSRMNLPSWHNVSETVSSYKLDDQIELDFEPEDSLR